MRTEIQQRLEVEFDLRSALADHQFRLVYQPIYNLDDLTIVGVEALLRWQHPTRGLIQPDEFLPILEQTRPDPRGRPMGDRPSLRPDGDSGTAEVTPSTSRSTSRAVSSRTMPSSGTSPTPSRPVVLTPAR